VFERRLGDEDLLKQSNDSKYRDVSNGLSTEEIEKYFSSREDKETLQNSAPKYAPLPTKHFYQKYPDSIRYYLTETSFYDAPIMRNAHETIVNLLRLRGIDIINATFTKDKIREALYKDILSSEIKVEQEKR